jgi:iron-sulfur cluster assembly accessory protein
MDTAPASAPAAPFHVSERAARRIAEIVASQGGDAALRVEVQGGGCSGLRYEFDLDRETRPDDIVIERAGARVLVDTTSLEFLGGAELDYTDALMGAHFAVKNPNASASCGCGTSFSVD